MAKVNMKDTDYYKSGQHLQNVLKAARKGHKTQELNRKNKILEYAINPIYCIVCGLAHTYKKRKNKTCSANCGTRFGNLNRSEDSREKQRTTLLTNLGKEIFPKKIKKPSLKLKKEYKEPVPKYSKLYTLECRICKKIKFVKSSLKDRKTCGNEDCRIQASVGVRTYQNGSRKPVKFYNPYEDKIVLLESSWEVIIANLLIERNIRWIRPKFIKWQDSKGKTRRYFPDFYLPDQDVYLDPKNPYCMKQDQEKMFEVTKQVKVIYGSVGNIKDYIDNTIRV